MPKQNTKEFVDAIVISIIIASIFSIFLGETANVIREKISTKFYELPFPLSLVVVFTTMIGWVAFDLIAFIFLFYKLYWIKARSEMPKSWKDAIYDMLILAPAATIPWLPLHLFHISQEPVRSDIHISYFLLWGLLLVIGVISRHYRFKKSEVTKNKTETGMT